MDRFGHDDDADDPNRDFVRYTRHLHAQQVNLAQHLQANLRAARYNRAVRQWQALLRQIFNDIREEAGVPTLEIEVEVVHEEVW